MTYLAEYKRMIGQRTLLEKVATHPMLKVLSKAFSADVRFRDVPYIRYRRQGRGLELIDQAARLGGILTSVEPKDVNIQDLQNFLDKYGAKAGQFESRDQRVEAINFEVFKTGDASLDKAVNWLLQKSKSRVLSDGTVAYFFEGTLPLRMIDTFWRAKKNKILKTVDTRTETLFNWSGQVADFALGTGGRKSTQRKVRFMANDYTVPAQKNESFYHDPYPGLLGPQFEAGLERGYVNLGLLHPKAIKVLDRSYLAGAVEGAMDPETGVSFIRDPNNLLSKARFSIQSLFDDIKDGWVDRFREQEILDRELGQRDRAERNAMASVMAKKAKITSQRVTGKDGSKAYKIIMKPAPAQIKKKTGASAPILTRRKKV